jgi:hypothetical protein
MSIAKVSIPANPSFRNSWYRPDPRGARGLGQTVRDNLAVKIRSLGPP